MPAKSVKQRRFMGMVRAVQKGEMDAPSPEIASAAKDMGSKAVREFAKTKEKNLPMKKEEVEIEEGMSLKDFKANRRKLKRREASADAKKRGHVGKEWYNSGRTYSPDEAKAGRANMQDHERSTRHRSAMDPEGDDSNYSADKTKNPKKLRKQKAMGESISFSQFVESEVEHLEEMPYQVYGSTDGKKEKKIGKPVKSKKYADARAAELADTHKATGGKYRSEYTEETIVERGDYWHPDPEKDRKLGGPGANQRAREDRADAAKPKEDPKKLRKGESYMDYAKRQKGGTAAPKKKEGLRDKLKRKLGLKEDAPTMSTGSTGSAAGFSSEADADGPTAGLDQPLGGTTRLRGKGGTPKKRKFKCRKSDDGVNQVCGG